jgi:6-phosphogluconate dehydrogenase
MSTNQYDFGLVGLGVMGRNFILNVADNGYSAFGLDTNAEQVAALKEEGDPNKVDASTDKEVFINSLSRPRKIMLLVPAGKVVDMVIQDLLPLLDEGDIIIDGGNSFFTDTDRRAEELEAKGIHFFGAGVSGGAKGARRGPSIMPGGSKAGYEVIQPIFEAVAAKVNGEPCVDYMGKKSAGNYVKMVHNGIEYGLMELISEVYWLMKRGMVLENDEIQSTFAEWNEGRLQSFLIEITADIFSRKDELTDADLIDVILDKAKQKGTGKWTSQNAMDLGIPVPTIDMAVSMRQISAVKDTRQQAQELYGLKTTRPAAELTKADLEDALYFAFIVTYAQGMTQLAAADKEYGYGMDMATIAKIWRGGCIIRAALLEDMRAAYAKNPKLESLLLDDGFVAKIQDTINAARKVAAYAIDKGIPAGGLSSAVAYFDAFTSGRLYLNLVQAQRDHFGSHTYERLDREGTFHTEW